MGLEDLFDGIVYSDYAKCDFMVKPEPSCYKEVSLPLSLLEPDDGG